MGETVKIDIRPAIQLGGSLFSSSQLLQIVNQLGADEKVEMTTFKQLYAEVLIPKRSRKNWSAAAVLK